MVEGVLREGRIACTSVNEISSKVIVYECEQATSCGLLFVLAVLGT
jgi:hypothetical protein